MSDFPWACALPAHITYRVGSPHDVVTVEVPLIDADTELEMSLPGVKLAVRHVPATRDGWNEPDEAERLVLVSITAPFQLAGMEPWAHAWLDHHEYTLLRHRAEVVADVRAEPTP